MKSRWLGWSVSAAIATVLLASTSCMVDNRISCRGRIERRCHDAWIQRCDRWGCAPYYYVDCYDICIEPPPSARPLDAGTDARPDTGAVATCYDDVQCPGGTRCSLGRCVAICFDDRDCPSGWSCLRGLCTDRPVQPPVTDDAGVPNDAASARDADSGGAGDASTDAVPE
jgi:hypothetical protein